MQARVLEARVAFLHRPFARPLRLSTGDITEITEARAEVRVRVEGREAVGRGTVYLSDLWAWPDPSRSHAERDKALRTLCEQIAARLDDLCGGEAAHPLELGMRLHASVCGPRELPPLIARAMCLSPFDAALHDAAGHAASVSAFALYPRAVPIPSADPLFAGGSACAAIVRMLRPPCREFDAWLVVGETDPVETEIGPWVRERGYHAFKLKLLGREAAEDAARAAGVFRAARALGARRPRLSADFNGACPDVDYAAVFLERLRALDPEAFDALEYVEQPTGRDIQAHGHDWRGIARVKPILLDEGLTGPERLETAAAQGWSGFALKTCKGHSFALVAAAWARERGMYVAMQDLTNPGLAAIHAALFAAYVPTVNGVELNSPQFTPAANAEWLPRMAGLLEPADGMHRLPAPVPPGLGSRL